ncbi:hypothetical protein EDB83DRAFT_166172 [Lactarius deliciosus]|nr:hypothetical protein EDB83DRAFT_166172 [Lactarius deliciosus]
MWDYHAVSSLVFGLSGLSVAYSSCLTRHRFPSLLLRSLHPHTHILSHGPRPSFFPSLVTTQNGLWRRGSASWHLAHSKTARAPCRWSWAVPPPALVCPPLQTTRSLPRTISWE